MADFETTTNPDDCRVWVWGSVDIDDPRACMDWGLDIQSFADWCARGRRVVYFHNLAFDGMFILDFVLRNGYVFRDKEWMHKGSFNALISDDGKFYTITVRWRSGNTTEFRDSFKKLPMSVARIGRAYGGELLKGSIDYHSSRPIGHMPTDDELQYLEADVRIVANALAQQFDEGMRKLTTGADSLAEYRHLTTGKAFDQLFPVLTLTMDAEIRKAYRGGWAFVNPRFKNCVTGGGKVYDVNSLYPFVMRERLLPYDVPIWRDGMPIQSEEYPLFIASLTFTAKLKSDHLPCIQIKGSPHFVATEYLSEIAEPTTLVCTNVDLELWEQHYDMDILSWNGYFAFKGMRGLFDTYIDKWAAIKANSKGGLREIAKLHLNSLYGKFATNPNVTGKIPTFENGIVQLTSGPLELRNPVYTAMGAFITAYARQHTITAAQRYYDVFAYADTDSLHLITRDEPDGLNVHPTELGAWKHEYDFNSAIYVRAKCYSEKIELPTWHRRNKRYRHETHIAGLPDWVARKVTLADFHNGKIFKGKLTPKRVPGGVVLVATDYTLAMGENSA